MRAPFLASEYGDAGLGADLNLLRGDALVGFRILSLDNEERFVTVDVFTGPAFA